MVITELASDAGVIAKSNDGVNTLASVGSCLNRRDALTENLGVKILVLLHPGARLLRSAPISRTGLALIGQKAERTSGGRTVTSEAKKDRRLVCAIEGSKKMPTGIGNDLGQLGRDARARGRRELRQGLSAEPGSKAQPTHAMSSRVELPKVTRTRSRRRLRESLRFSLCELRRLTLMLDTFVLVGVPKREQRSDEPSNS